MGMSLAVLALLGRVDAVQLRHHHESREYAQTSREDQLDNDDGEQYMAESIKEAEKEVSERKNGQVNVAKEELIKSEEETNKEEDTNGGSESAKKIKAMT